MRQNFRIKEEQNFMKTEKNRKPSVLMSYVDSNQNKNKKRNSSLLKNRILLLTTDQI